MVEQTLERLSGLVSERCVQRHPARHRRRGQIAFVPIAFVPLVTVIVTVFASRQRFFFRGVAEGAIKG